MSEAINTALARSLARAVEALRIADDLLWSEGLGDDRIHDVLAEHGISDDRQRFDWENRDLGDR